MVDVRSEEVVDLTSPTNTKHSSDLEVQIVKTKIRKARPSSAAIRSRRQVPPLPDVFIAEDNNKNKKKKKSSNGLTSGADDCGNACENGSSNLGQLECRICIDKVKQPAATPCG